MIIFSELIFASALGAAPWADLRAQENTCHPISSSVSILDETGRLSQDLVFVEEHSVCTGVPIAPSPVLVPPHLSGREALQFIVDETAPAVAHVARYEVTDRLGGYYVAPVGWERALDVRVSVDAEASPTVHDARLHVYWQVRDAIGLEIGPIFGDGPTVAFQPNAVSMSDAPLLETLHALFEPHVHGLGGFILAIDGVDGARVGEPGWRGSTHLEHLMHRSVTGPDLPMAAPETAWAIPPTED